ncbi:MAG: penicillin-binding protein 1C [Candidatus Sumerlaeaceae bacterium]|nr:penicillin-binding protein 1C [Candidatus Sumerlaeaceae bacterium]
MSDTILHRAARSWKTRVWSRRWRRRSVIFLSILAGLCLLGLGVLMVAVRICPFDPSELSSGEISSLIFDRKGRPLRAYTATDERWRIPVKLSEISPWLVKATIAVEDKRFYEHGGVDLVSICRAAISNITRGRIVSGASTISMQVAVLGEPRLKTIPWKLRQAFRGLQVEHVLTKEQILEIYFINAPYGGNICGVEAAARRYFNKSAAEVTLAEAALIAGLPQSPTRLRPDRFPEAALRRSAHVLERMRDNGAITDEDYQRALKQKPEVGNFDAPAEAPHFADLVHAMYPREPRLHTTLDLDIQREAEKLLKSQVRELADRGVSNGSMVVIDNSNGEVIAMVGSYDYDTAAISGQVNGALAERSPGSTLKPLIYAAAFDSAGLLPGTILYDVPMQFRGYDPENFDRSYNGLVRADKALAWSLNIPAIQVLQQVGLPRMLRLLRAAGLGTLRETPGEYGLSLAIGTCSVRLLDLANAYSVLARGGEYVPWRVILPAAGEEKVFGRRPTLKARLSTDARITTELREMLESDHTTGAMDRRPVRILTEGASFLVSRALSDPSLRAPEGIAPELSGLENVAWKTGTSSGLRDAWTFAYDSHYTVGVWMGNFDGRPSRALIGSESAAPVALKMMKRLQTPNSSQWPRKPKDVGSAVICSDTGLAAGPDCPTTKSADRLLFPQQTSSPLATIAICPIHRKLPIDNATGTELCPRCMSGRAYEMRTFAFWPMPVASWLAKHGQSGPLPPRHFAECETITKSPAPRITSPKADDVFIVTAGRDVTTQKVALEATAPPACRTLYWFDNGEMIQSTAPGETGYLLPKAGSHTIRCVDEYGRADWITFTVQVELCGLVPAAQFEHDVAVFIGFFADHVRSAKLHLARHAVVSKLLNNLCGKLIADSFEFAIGHLRGAHDVHGKLSVDIALEDHGDFVFHKAKHLVASDFLGYDVLHNLLQFQGDDPKFAHLFAEFTA